MVYGVVDVLAIINQLGNQAYYHYQIKTTWKLLLNANNIQTDIIPMDVFFPAYLCSFSIVKVSTILGDGTTTLLREIAKTNQNHN